MNPTRKFPTPWLADSEWLLDELAKVRETILKIPFRLDNQSDIQAAIDRVWHLERTLRDLLHYHRDGQRSFARQAADAQSQAQAPCANDTKAKRSTRNQPKIVRIGAH